MSSVHRTRNICCSFWWGFMVCVGYIIRSEHSQYLAQLLFSFIFSHSYSVCLKLLCKLLLEKIMILGYVPSVWIAMYDWLVGDQWPLFVATSHSIAAFRVEIVAAFINQIIDWWMDGRMDLLMEWLKKQARLALCLFVLLLAFMTFHVSKVMAHC